VCLTRENHGAVLAFDDDGLVAVDVTRGGNDVDRRGHFGFAV
jgi:hypothetical protein